MILQTFKSVTQNSLILRTSIYGAHVLFYYRFSVKLAAAPQVQFDNISFLH